MGQYWMVVNLDKREFIHPHKLACGVKLWECLASPGVGQALVILLAAMPNPRGGGDLEKDSEVAQRTIGRWAGDRICLVGDYAEDSDMPNVPDFRKIYNRCYSQYSTRKFNPETDYKDVTDDVCAVIEAELGGKFFGDGWRHWKNANGSEDPTGMKPDRE